MSDKAHDPAHDGAHDTVHYDARGFPSSGPTIHGWFGLSYAAYLVLPRTMLQSMPAEWQADMVRLLEVMDRRFGPITPEYQVNAKGPDGRFVADDLADYQRGRRVIPPRRDDGA